MSTEHLRVELEAKLASVNASRSRLDEQERAIVKEARDAGLSWEAVAELFGVSRQAVWQRFAGVDESVTPEPA